jgi:hypothetical protein
MRRLSVFLLVSAIAMASIPTWVLAQEGNQYQVRYRGGTVAAKVKPTDWSNILTINPDTIQLRLKDGQNLLIDPKKVSAVSYDEEATRRVKTYAGTAVIIPFFAVRLNGKKHRHFVGLEYTTGDGKNAALLLESKSDQYQALLASLKAVTGKEARVEEKKKHK